MNTTRRTLLQVAAGGAAGLAVSPAPYRLLTSVTLRTQNAPWAPPVPRGPITVRANNCTLCAGGCALKLRMAGSMPFGIQPAEDPLCPAAFAAHHLAFHPQRLRSVLHNGQAAKVQDAIAALKQRGPVAVLDLAPGRTASLLHRWHLQSIPNSLYIEPPAIEGATAAALSRLLKKPVKLAADLRNTRTIVSLGTPVLEGWAPLRAVLHHDIVQIEAQRSHTADVATRWLETFSEAAVREARKPAIVLADGDPANGPQSKQNELFAAILNVQLGALGTAGGFIPVVETPAPAKWAGIEPTALETIPDASIRTLIVDEPAPGCAINWNTVQRKLTSDAVVFACSWTQSRKAEWQIPSPVYLESMQDAPPAPSSADAMFRLTTAVLPPLAGALEAATLVGMLVGDETPYAQHLEKRAAAIHATGRGRISDTPVKDMDWKAFWTALTDGGSHWEDLATPAVLEVAELPPLPAYTPANRDMRTPGWRPAAASPLLAKLWQDTDLRKAPGVRS